MNRRARRAVAAQARGARPGYLHRLTRAHAALGDQLRGRVVQTMIEHDGRCAIYKGGTCNCVPNIWMHPVDGAEIIIVDEHGQTTKRVTS